MHQLTEIPSACTKPWPRCAAGGWSGAKRVLRSMRQLCCAADGRPRGRLATMRAQLSTIASGPSRLPAGIAADWIYFATPSKANDSGTAHFALRDGVLWRKAHNSAGALIANVGNVDIGDVILLAYGSGNGKYSAVGTFRVLEPRFPVDRAPALHQVEGDLGARLTAAGYDVDPHLGVHTGFLVETEWTPSPGERVPVDRPAGNNALWRA